ncbi:hypothetical protein D3C72_2078320 [compost metagenome]
MEGGHNRPVYAYIFNLFSDLHLCRMPEKPESCVLLQLCAWNVQRRDYTDADFRCRRSSAWHWNLRRMASCQKIRQTESDNGRVCLRCRWQRCLLDLSGQHADCAGWTIY